MASPAVVGIDVGGTRIKSCVLTPWGGVLDELVRPTPEHVGETVGPVVAEIVRDHRARLVTRSSKQTAGAAGADAEPGETELGPTIGAVGVVVPGVVDEQRGIGRYAANLGWRDLDLSSAIAEAINLPFAVGHDVRAGLLAEHQFGAAVGAENVLFVPLGTGIASAVLSGGRLLSDPRSGEIGHVVVDPTGAVCECGARGCLETIASARAIARRFEQRLGDGSSPLTAQTAADVARLVEESEPAVEAGSVAALRTQAAVDVWIEAVQALASVLAPVVVALGVETVLVGGGLVRSGETLLHPLRQAIAARLGAGMVGGLGLEVRAAALGDRAGSLGAGVIALKAIDA